MKNSCSRKCQKYRDKVLATGLRASGIRTFAGAKKVVLCALSIRWLTLREQRMECRPGCGAVALPLQFPALFPVCQMASPQYALHSA